MPITKLLRYPVGSYLMIRLDYVIICGDELEAKIMRIIEMYMEDERRREYQELANRDPAVTPDITIDIDRNKWVPISHRLFMNDLYGLVKSENTLKRAIKSLKDKKYIRISDPPTKQYEAPKYQINIEVVQGELDKLAKLGKSGYQKLIPSKSDTIKNSPHQNLTPSGYQEMTPSEAFRVSKSDTNSIRDYDKYKDTVEESIVVSASAENDAPAFAIQIEGYPQFFYHDFCNQEQDRGCNDGLTLVVRNLADVPQDAECQICYKPVHGPHGYFEIGKEEAPAATIHDLQKWKEESGKHKAVTLSDSQADIGNFEGVDEEDFEGETQKMPAMPKGANHASNQPYPSSDLYRTGSHLLRTTENLRQDEMTSQKPDAGTRSSAVNPLVGDQDDSASVQAPIGSPADAAQRTALPQGGAVQASIPKRPRGKKPPVLPDEQPQPKCDTREIQRRVNEHRGYALEEKGQILQERIAIKSWCNMHTLEEYGLVMAGAKNDKYWGKTENYYRIGGLTLLKITPEILARQRQPLQLVANGHNGHSNSNQDGLVYQGDLVLWQGQWMTEEEANETGYNGGFGLYK